MPLALDVPFDEPLSFSNEATDREWVWCDAMFMSPPALTLTAVATDDVGASTTSASVGITVSDGSAVTVTLQDGTNGYQGTADVYLDRYLPTYNRGASSELYDKTGTFSALVRFAIFQSEGGPVPDGATITSATRSLTKT